VAVIQSQQKNNHIKSKESTHQPTWSSFTLIGAILFLGHSFLDHNLIWVNEFNVDRSSLQNFTQLKDKHRLSHLPHALSLSVHVKCNLAGDNVNLDWVSVFLHLYPVKLKWNERMRIRRSLAITTQATKPADEERKKQNKTQIIHATISYQRC